MQVLQKPSSKSQVFHYMKTGIKYMEVKQSIEPAFLTNHRRKSLTFLTVVLTNQDLLILI